MPGPIEPQLLRRSRATRVYLVAGIGVGVVTAILTLVQGRVLADTITSIFAASSIFDGSDLAILPQVTAILIGVFVAKAVLSWASEWVGRRAAARVKAQLRGEIVESVFNKPLGQARTSGGLVNLVTQGLDALDDYYAKYLPQLGLAATVPPIVCGVVFFSDITSALIMIVTIPLIPVFMALVGWTTEARTSRRWKIQNRLANHFADLITGLPTLQSFGRARAQLKGLSKTEAAHRKETAAVLRLSFLSSLTLELLATLSVAVVAVTIGFRVVFFQLDLATALFILIVAPEAYLPVRQVGAHFHDSVNGVTAAKSAFKLIDGESNLTDEVAADDNRPELADGEIAEDGQGQVLRVKDLTHTYPGANAPALVDLSFSIAEGEVVALTGPSGCGKTTALSAIMGFLTPTGGEISHRGRPVVDWNEWRTSLAFVGQQPRLIAGTVADNVRIGFPQASDLDIRKALDAAGGADIELDHLINQGGSGVSAGQTRRIAIARAVLRVTFGQAKLLIMDEPTAGLDADSEAIWLANLRALKIAALVVTHRQSVLDQAERIIRLAAPKVENSQTISSVQSQDQSTLQQDRSQVTQVAQIADFSTSLSTSSDSPSSSEVQRSGQLEDAEGERVLTDLAGICENSLKLSDEEIADDFEIAANTNSNASLLSRLFAAVPRSKSRLAFSIFLAFFATASSVALMGVSAWLISRAGEHPPVLYLEVAAVMVRFFGISRGVFRYLERLFSHGVALRLQSALRLEIYSALSKTTLLGRSQGDLLSRVITDAESIANLIVRVWIPFLSSAFVIILTSTVLAFWSPNFAIVLLLTSIAASLLVPAIANISSKKADVAAVELRGELADVITEINFAATDLVAYQAQGKALRRFTNTDARLQRHEATSSWVLGVAEGAQVLAAGATVIAALWIAGAQVVAGTLPPVMLAVLVLTPLALHESLSVLTKAAQSFTTTNVALRRTEELIKAATIGSGDKVDTPVLSAPELSTHNLSVGWPGAETIAKGINLRVQANERVALVGPSGIGKTTVATTIMGMIPPVLGEVEVRGSLGYLAQDAHIFSTSVAENVRIGKKDATDAEIVQALKSAGLGDIDLDLAVGETGQALSGGETHRLALARLLVGDYQIWILDEPTEHLDQATAEAVLKDIWERTKDRATLIITHDIGVISLCDRAEDLRMG